MTCDERRDQIFLFIVGALEPAESEQLRAHLVGGCASCNDSLLEAQELELDLALSLEPVAPPPEVLDRVLALVESEAAEASEASETADVEGEQGGATARRRALVRSLVAAGIASVVAATVGGAVGGLVGHRLGSRGRSEAVALVRAELAIALETRITLKNDLEEVLAEQATTDEELGDLEMEIQQLSDAATQADKEIALLRSVDVEVLAMASTQSDAGSARIFWEWDDYYCYLHAKGLAPAEVGHVYALWLVTEDGNIVLAGTFDAQLGGDATLWSQLPSDTGKVVRASVTLEPLEVGAEPTSEALLRSASS